MAIFGKKSEVSNSSGVGSATIITSCTKIDGDIVGDDTVHIDGSVDGNVSVNNIVVIGKSGSVKGNIKAQKVICSGNIEGSVECEDIEILEGSTVSHKISSDIIIINGEFKGEILCNRALIDEQGLVSNVLQAKEVTVKGTFSGDVACDTLTTKSTGLIKGSMFVKNILNEGGNVEGAIGQYKNLLVPETKALENNSVDVEVEE
jgi:cytoskeletal protein CcmA (bactofilin family)